MDFSEFLIAGVQPLILVPGLVQFVKAATGIKDKAAEVLTVTVSAGMIGLAYALNSNLIPAVAGGLAIAGYYKLIKSAAKGIITASTTALVTSLTVTRTHPPTRVPYEEGYGQARA